MARHENTQRGPLGLTMASWVSNGRSTAVRAPAGDTQTWASVSFRRRLQLFGFCVKRHGHLRGFTLWGNSLVGDV